MSAPRMHDPKAKQAMLGRLARVEGQVRAIHRMIDRDADCEDIAQQMSAARRALDRAFYEMVACMIRAGAGEPAGAHAANGEQVAALLARYG